MGSNPPYGWQPPPRRARAAWVVGAGSVGAVIALGLTLFFTVDGGGTKNDTSSPKAAVASFLAAAENNDILAEKAVACSSLQERITRHPGEFRNTGDERLAGFAVRGTTRHGDQADVTVLLKSNLDSTEAQTFVAVKESGRWKVCGNTLDDNGSGS